jgi:TolB-like protein/DNA-binding winged helix-turn-helix (wHTH) protein/Tfp pilus assembly protein PilF
LKNAETSVNSAHSDATGRLRVLDLEIDSDSGTVWRDGQVLDLPDLSFRLLATLVEQAPAMVSKDALVTAVWGDVVVSDETLAQRMRLLRQAIGDDSSAPRYGTAVRGRGYRLVAPVERAGTAAGRAASRPQRRGWIVAAVVLLAAALGGAIWRSDPGPATVESLAVLPFSDFSGGEDYRHFADGMQEEVLARLAKAGDIAVLSRTSVERYRDTELTIPEIAAQLDVDAVIEGSVRVTGDRLRITVQLIDAVTDRHVWAETFDAAYTVEDIFDIQQRVADEIADALELGPGRVERVLPTPSLEAYNRYLLGRYHTFRQTPDDLAAAVRNLDMAIELDPEFAEAYAALGWALAFQGTDYGLRPPHEVYPRAREAALRAIALDDSLADARSLYADILTWYDWDFDLAESEYRRTIELQPLNVLGYALYLSTQNRHDEAVELIERRVAAAPNDDYVMVNLAWRYLHAGRLREAIDAARKSGDHPDARSVLGTALVAAGDLDAGLRVFEEDIDRRGRGVIQLANLGWALFLAGRRDEGDAILAELETMAGERYVSPVSIAAVRAAAGDRDRAYELLEAAIEEQVRAAIFLGVSPSMAPLRREPEFAELLERIGLPPVE